MMVKQMGLKRRRKKAGSLKNLMTINSMSLIAAAAPRQALSLAKTVVKEMTIALLKVVKEGQLRAFQFLRSEPRSTPSTRD